MNIAGSLNLAQLRHLGALRLLRCTGALLRGGAEQQLPSPYAACHRFSTSAAAAATHTPWQPQHDGGDEDAPPAPSAAAVFGSARGPGAAADAEGSAEAPSFTTVGVASHISGKLPGLLLRSPTEIQTAALPALMRGVVRESRGGVVPNADHAPPPYDVLLHAPTGSGKTLAYLLPILSRLDTRACSIARTRAVIVTPTRELAHQVFTVASALARVGKRRQRASLVAAQAAAVVAARKGAKQPRPMAGEIRIAKLVGEVSAAALHELRVFPPHLVVGTPQTLARLLPGDINAGMLDWLVLDEADELARVYHAAPVGALLKSVARMKRRPCIVGCSATSSPALQALVGLHWRARGLAVVDTTGGRPVVPASIEHTCVRLGSAGEAHAAFLRLLQGEGQGGVGVPSQPAAAAGGAGAPFLVFHDSSASMEAMEAFLTRSGVPVGVLSNAVGNAGRAEALAGVASGRLRVLLSTEMAARGLDIPRLVAVVNFDGPPRSAREYVHRAGRVGRIVPSAAAAGAGAVDARGAAPGRAGPGVAAPSADSDSEEEGEEGGAQTAPLAPRHRPTAAEVKRLHAPRRGTVYTFCVGEAEVSRMVGVANELSVSLSVRREEGQGRRAAAAPALSAPVLLLPGEASDSSSSSPSPAGVATPLPLVTYSPRVSRAEASEAGAARRAGRARRRAMVRS